ncbi:hypothetical protein ACELLULO517_06530 [Acidisoma cellulosilytica]|uniref:Mll5186 protein n=1 Tax=Acidisoma cellulosilyticum TaxID=2802395 RepID=A0A963YZ86_9PROT|nr:hypothetical protein [Acidisoma cellulosilyticum]MCB8879883.1 hypothetical protein [Acidisoma cellulosilyticum]
MSFTSTEPGLRLAARPGLSWGAVFGGAVVATAVTVMLTAAGSAFGLAWISPVSSDNPSPVTFTVVAAIWLIIVQWVASFFGGYLAGRLRPALPDIHRDEVTFRDTASGFVAWAVTALFILGLVASGIGSFAGSFAKAAAAVTASVDAGSASIAAQPGAPTGYDLDKLFRPSRNSAQTSNPQAKAEAGRILATAAVGSVSQPDHDYLVQLVEAQTGLAQADASARVDQAIIDENQMIAKAKQVANAARKAAGSFAAYTFFSMLIGAFIACVAGAIGGRQRDAF